MITLRFFAVEDADAFSPPATRIGRMTPIGKTRNADGSTSLVPGPAAVTLGDAHTAADLGFLRSEVLGGRIRVADADTAHALEVPFNEKKADVQAAKESKL